MYYKLTISGQHNLEKFAEKINFISERKQKRLAGIVGKSGNTNVDVIPGLAPIFKEIDQLFGFQLHGIQDISAIKRGAYSPSPEKLQKIIGAIEERMQRFEELAPTFRSLKELPELAKKFGKLLNPQSPSNKKN